MLGYKVQTRMGTSYEEATTTTGCQETASYFAVDRRWSMIFSVPVHLEDHKEDGHVSIEKIAFLPAEIVGFTTLGQVYCYMLVVSCFVSCNVM